MISSATEICGNTRAGGLIYYNHDIKKAIHFADSEHIIDTELSWKTGVHTQTIRKLIRQGKINVRQIPNGPYAILRKESPKLQEVSKENPRRLFSWCILDA